MFEKIIEQQFGIECIPEYKFLKDRKFKFDYAIPVIMVAIEVEGGIYTGRAHGSITGILRDIEKYNLATCEGWRVIRILPKELLTVKTFDMIKKLINL
jgi:hypothetical protein